MDESWICLFWVGPAIMAKDNEGVIVKPQTSQPTKAKPQNMVVPTGLKDHLGVLPKSTAI